jgi:hypothetical protein
MIRSGVNPTDRALLELGSPANISLASKDAEPTGRPLRSFRLEIDVQRRGAISQQSNEQARVELIWLMGQLAPDFKTIADWNGSLASEAAKT